MLFIGVDGGGTDTVAVACDEGGRVLGLRVAESANYHNVGADTAKKNLEKLVSSLISASASDKADGVFYALAGIDSERDRRTMEGVLAEIPRVREFVVANDTQSLYYAVCGSGPGIVVIAGTGANAYGRNSRGESWRAGDHGSLLGDDGSAYFIAVQALRAVMKAHDGRGSYTSLTRVFRGLYGVDDLEELPAVFYSLKQDVAEIASLARYVDREARKGDGVSRAILVASGRELASSAEAVARKLQMHGEPYVRVGGSGGVLYHSRLVWTSFRTSVSRVLPNSAIVAPIPSHVSAVGGIVYFLSEKLGRPLDEQELERIRREMKAKMGFHGA